jgi:hypothetical protein
MPPLLDKMAPDQKALDDLARDLRAAVLGSDHEKASRLTEEYSEALRRHWTTLSPAECAASSLPKQSLVLLTWVRQMTLMQQAMTAAHLGLVEKASRHLMARNLYLQTAALGAQR